MTGLNDPVGANLVSSLSRPGGNITGMATLNDAAIFKLLELLPSVFPNARRIAVLLNPTNPSKPILLGPISAQISQLGLSIVPVEVATPAALESAFQEIRNEAADVLLVAPDNALISISSDIVSRALAQGLPVISTSGESAQAGGLISYGYLRRESIERAALYIKKILAGTLPSDLPVEQPSAFHMVVNVKTARLLGLTIPPSLLARADEVIE